MRTTVRLPDDLYRRVRVTAAEEGQTVTSFLERALREALDRRHDEPDRPVYRVEPFHGGLLNPGVDLDDNSALEDVMGADARD
jgi:hypothetical protein